MSNRFFKLLYVFGLITIVLSFPIYLLSVIHFDQIVVSSYKAKCLSNNKYVVLQGASSYDDAFVFEETFLTDTVIMGILADATNTARLKQIMIPIITVMRPEPHLTNCPKLVLTSSNRLM